MKNLYKKIIVAVVSMFITLIPATAYASHRFSIKLYKCNHLDENLACVNAQGTEIEPEEITSTSTVNPGEVIKVSTYYEPDLDYSDVSMQYSYYYDQTLVEPVYAEGDDDLYCDVDTRTTYNGGIWPAKSTAGNNRFATNWTVLFHDDTINYAVTHIAKDTMVEKPLVTSGVLSSEYFTVKSTAPADSLIEFNFEVPYCKMANKSSVTTVNNSVRVYKELDNDTSLKSLTVTNGSTNYLTNFNASTKTYTVYVPNSVSNVTINTETNKTTTSAIYAPSATNNNYSLSVSTSKTVTITTEAEDESTDTYTVNVYRLNNNANLSALSLTNVNFGTFASGTTSYTATVPYSVSSTNVSATPASNTATVSGTGNKNLSVGSNTVTVDVQAENCKSQYSSVTNNSCTSKSYTVNVTRTAASTVSTLNDLLVDGTRVKGFTPGDGTSTYTLDDVGYSKSSINITYVKGEDNETISGDGSKSLSVGDNTFNVVVTAEDGATKTTYTIKVHRKSNDATLKSMSVTSSKTGSLNYAFSSSRTEYIYNVDADETSVNISFEKNHSGASISTTPSSLTGINPRTTGSVSIEVTPEDTAQAKKTYTITFNVAKSTNNNLSDLTVDGSTLSGFNEDTTLYDITVPSNKESVTIGATQADDRASLNGDTGVQVLDYGENTFTITVTPEDPNEEAKNYVVKVTRTKKDNANATDIKVDNVSVPGFSSSDPSETEYDLGSVTSTKSAVNISVTTSDSDATVTGDGTQNLAIGDNRLPVTITAQNETISKTYYIKIRRQNNVNDLASLTVTSDPSGTLNYPFSANRTEYIYTADADEDEVIIDASVPSGSGATIVSGPGTYDPSTTNEVTIVVRAEDGSEKNYVITLNRAESSNANLLSLEVEGYDPFDLTSGEDHFTLTVPSNVGSANIIADAEDSRVKEITGDGEKSLSYGSNTFAVTVVAEDDTSKVYYVTITRSLKDNANLSDLKADGVTVPGFDPDDPSGTEYDLGTLTDTSKTTINIIATKADNDASVTGTGERALALGDNVFPVTVTAQDGVTTKTYNVKVRKPYNDASLTGLEVQADTIGSLNNDFDPSETSYIYTSDPDEDEVTIVVTPATGATATIVGHPDGKVNPQEGPEEIVIMVQAEDGSITNYTITVQRGNSSNNNLLSLEVEGYTPFDLTNGEDHFTLDVNEDVDTVNIIAEAEDNRIKSITGDGEKSLSYGSNLFTVTVKAEDNSEKNYYITINKELSSNVKLSELMVEGETIDEFDPNTPSYDYGTVGNDVTSLDIEAIAEAEEDGATVEVTGNDNLQVGENTITITVTAPDGETTGTYTITVTREANDDNTLASLEVEEYDPFDLTNGDDHFELTVSNDVDSVNVIAVMSTPDTSSITGDGTHDLEEGENTIEVIVTAENDVPKTYTIVITREQSQQEDELITSSIRIIADGYIKDVVYKSLPERLKNECDNENWKLHIFEIIDEEEVEVSEDQNLGTGMIIKLIKNDRVNDSDILVIKGEVTGDGIIKVADVVAAVNNFLDPDENPLEGAYFLAADMDDSGQIKVGDIVAIVNIFLEE